jgi:hypothetical protein
MAEKSWVDGIPWVIAVAGWGVTHIFSEGRERRKEARSQIDKLNESLSSLSDQAHRFHTSTEHDGATALDLQYRLRLLERQANRIVCVDSDQLSPAIIRLRRAITLRNFDKTEFQKQEWHSDILASINVATEGIEEEIERQYRFAYPATFPYIRIFTRKKRGTKVWSK